MGTTQKDLLKISQLAAAAGVSIPTVKHYLREGLLPRPVKTSRNMAYYPRENVDRIRLIKKIQKEKYLPLEVIKRLLDAGEAFEAELALGKAILKQDRVAREATPSRRAAVAAATGCPAATIDMLERGGLIHPLKQDGRKAYLPEDVEMIRIMADRDALGVPVATSMATLRIYGDAVARAVKEDINFFIRNIEADIPAEQAARFIGAADETLDRFIVAFRRKMLRQLSQEAIKSLGGLSENLAALNFLPVPGALLPLRPPQTPCLHCTYRLLKGDAPGAKEAADHARALGNQDPRLKALGILSLLMAGDAEKALTLIKEHIPEPAQSVLADGVAALVYLHAVDASAGFSVPMAAMNQVLKHLACIEKKGFEPLPDFLFARYVCGAAYSFLPEAFATRRKGVAILEALNRELDGITFADSDLPPWLVRTLTTEVAPALKIRVNRFLAPAYRKLGKQEAAAACLEALVAAAGPGSELATWAEMEKFKMAITKTRNGKNTKSPV